MRLGKLNYKTILILILLSTALLRLFRLDFPNKYVFDEVYHAFTAKEYLIGSKEAWEWWTTPPPGVAYEWTHPPLAKELMTSSMFLLNSTDAWVWRLPGVLMGTLSVYLVYLLGMRLLNDRRAAIFAAFAFSLDGLNFVQSRTGMNDIYFVTFMLASFLMLLNRKYFLSAILLGLSISSKWAAIYTLLVFIPYLLKEKKFLKLAYFFVIPFLVYLLSYSPFFLLGHTFNQFIQLQQQMWWYHTNLKATHAYASRWWSWPFNLYPVWYFVDYQKDKIANIYASGNPAVFWTGFAAILLTTWETFKRKSQSLFIIILGFFAFWLPWSISPRIMFLYHYSPSVPFLSLALGHILSDTYSDKRNKKLVLILLALFVISFALIFPFLTAVPIPRNWVSVFFMTNLSKNPF